MDEMPAWARFIPLGLLLLFLLSVPFMCRSESVEVSAPTAQAVTTGAGMPKSALFKAPKEGLLTDAHVATYVSTRERVRALRDQRLASKQSTASVERDAVSELGFNYDEYRWIKARVEEVQRRDTGPGKGRRLQTNFLTLHRSRNELKAVGVILPPYDEFYRGTTRQSPRMAQTYEEWQQDQNAYNEPDYGYQQEQAQPRRIQGWSTNQEEMRRQEAEAHRQLQQWQQQNP